MLFTICVIGMFMTIYTVLELRLYSIVNIPAMSDLVKHIDDLKKDNFDSIPIERYKDARLIVLDENNNPLIKTDNVSPNITFTQSEIDKIPDFNDADDFFEVSSMSRKGKNYYMITRAHYEDGVKVINDYSIINEDYKIIEGSLFGEKEKLTEREFNFLKGEFSSNFGITKFVYTNYKGLKRTVIMVTPELNADYFNDAVSSIYKLWWILVPSFFLILFIFSLLISRQIKKYIAPVNEAVLGVTRGSFYDVSKYKGPYEFKEIMENFNDLSQRLEESEKKREYLDMERQRILTDISHDLKTPITVIQGYSKAICDGLVSEETKDKYIEIIEKKAEAVSALTDSFFEYSKIDHPDFTVNTEKCDICEFCKEYLAEKYQELEISGFELHVEIPEEPMYCKIDRTLFRRVIENIITNAVKYNPGGTCLYFEINSEAYGAVITIGDYGIGIPESMATTIFEPFITGDVSRTSGKGTGLGMAIVKKIVDAHHGNIRLMFPPSKGLSTEFKIIIPKAY